MTLKTPEWTTDTLLNALQDVELFTSGRASIELIDGAEASLHIVMHEYGAVLWQASAVTDPVGFNETLLRTHKYFPLSSICLDSVSGDEDYYQMFGSLSSGSVLASVVFEIEMLASNVIQATEAYSEFLNVKVEE